MFSFLLELIERAFIALLDSIGWTALLVAFLTSLLVALYKGWKAGGSLRQRCAAVTKHFLTNIMREASICGAIAYGLVLLTYAFWIIPRDIREQAKSLPSPKMIGLSTPHPPAFAFVRHPRMLSPRQILIETAPSLGNLRLRAIDLSNEIMGRLYMYGFPRNPRSPFPAPYYIADPWPKTGKGIIKWYKDRTSQFRFFYLNRVIAIRNELFDLHYRDQELDEILKHQEHVEDVGGKMQEIPMPGLMAGHPEIGSCGDDIARRLRVLAAEVK